METAIGRVKTRTSGAREPRTSSGKSVENKTLFLQGLHAVVLNYKRSALTIYQRSCFSFSALWRRADPSKKSLSSPSCPQNNKSAPYRMQHLATTIRSHSLKFSRAIIKDETLIAGKKKHIYNILIKIYVFKSKF